MDDCLENQPSLYMKLSRKSLEDIQFLHQLEQEPKSMRNWKRQSTFQRFLQHLDSELASLSDTTAIQLAEKIEWFIHCNYHREISNAILHKELNYHPNYLAKNMLKVYGMTPIEYLQYYRIEQAKKLLLQTNWQVAKALKRSASIMSLIFLPALYVEKGFHQVTLDANIRIWLRNSMRILLI